MANSDPLYEAYIKAKATAFRNGGRLTAKNFLNSVDPHNKYTSSQANAYMERLRLGEDNSDYILDPENTDGQRYTVILRDSTGAPAGFAVVGVPVGVSLFEVYRDGRLMQSVQKYLDWKNSLTPQQKVIYDIQSPPLDSSNMEGLSIAGVKPITTTRKKVQWVGKKK